MFFCGCLKQENATRSRILGTLDHSVDTTTKRNHLAYTIVGTECVERHAITRPGTAMIEVVGVENRQSQKKT